MTPTSSTARSVSLTSTPSTSASATEWKLDLFAKKYIPKDQRDINNAPVLCTVHCPPPAYVDFEEYAQSFLSKPLYHACASSQFLVSIRDARYAMDTPTLGPQIPLHLLTIQNYALRFRNLLIEERKSLILDFKQYDMFEVKLRPLKQQDMYRINVPGLREDNTPAIFVGHSLSVRAIRIYTPPYYGTPVKYFDGTEYIAYISAIDRMKVKPRILDLGT